MEKELFDKLPFWENLTEKEKDLVAQSAVIKTYEKAEIIHSSDDLCLGAINIISGEVRTFMMSDEGREITLFKIGEGETCVLSAACVMDAISFEVQMIAEDKCEILIITAAVLSKLSESNIYVKCFMYETATERFSDVMWAMQQLLFLRIDQRIASFLIDESVKNKSDEIQMTHEQIAVQINSAREVVARMLKRFESEKIVELGRGKITITDKENLKRLVL